RNEHAAGPTSPGWAEDGQSGGGFALRGDDDASSSPPIDFVPGITQDPPQRPAATPPDAAEPAVAGQDAPAASGHPTPEDDVDGETVVRVGAAAVLEWDDGTGLELDGRVVVGRNPAEEDGAAVVAVRDETLSLSKTHFEIVVESGTAWLIDRHSTNGVTIVRDGERIPAKPGERIRLVPNDVLEMGDRAAAFRGRAG
ncbi:FHA domain-containing protein, partial [Microbacterium halotolerans]|uniref:FHA domain-containing protein n=1 Tax=Microbacterium halotolerans TaxID=246613 RepID=UPI0013C2E784